MSKIKTKKEDYDMWARFIVMSDAEWSRCKRKDKQKSNLAKYYVNDCGLRKALDKQLDAE